MPVPAVQPLNNDVLPTFEECSGRIEAALSNNGREFCRHEDQHPYELFPHPEGIACKRTRIHRQ